MRFARLTFIGTISAVAVAAFGQQGPPPNPVRSAGAARLAFDAAVSTASAGRAAAIDKAAADYRRALADACRNAMAGKGDLDEANRIAAELKRLPATDDAAAGDPPRGADAKAARREFDRGRRAATAVAVQQVQAARETYLAVLRGSKKAALDAADRPAANRINDLLTAASSATAADAVAAAADAVDLLAGFTPTDGLSGVWTAAPTGGLRADPAAAVRLQLGRPPAAEYDFAVQFRRASTPHTAGPPGEVLLVIDVAGRPFAFAVGDVAADGRLACGFGDPDPSADTAGLATAGQPITVTVHVRHDGLAADVNGIEIARAKVDATPPVPPAAQVAAGHLGVTAVGTSLTIEAATAVPVRPPAAAKVAAALPAPPAPRADAGKAVLARHAALLAGIDASLAKHRLFLVDHKPTKTLFDKLRATAADLVAADGKVNVDVARTVYAIVNQDFENNLRAATTFHSTRENQADHDKAVAAIFADLRDLKRAVRQVTGVPDPKPTGS